MTQKTKRARIWIVEDDEPSAMLAQRMVEQGPYEVIGISSTGEDALEKLVVARPDMILMDLQLPGISGVETTRRIMQVLSVPVIAMTAAVDPQMIREISTAGICGYLTKPFVARDLFEAMAMAPLRFQALGKAQGTGSASAMAAGLRVLAVTDPESWRPPLEQRLACFDCRPTQVTSAIDALARLKQASYDVLLVDTLLPDGQGLDLLKLAADLYPRLPVIMRGDTITRSAAREILARGACDLLARDAAGPDIWRALLAAVQRPAKPVVEALDDLAIELPESPFRARLMSLLQVWPGPVTVGAPGGTDGASPGSGPSGLVVQGMSSTSLSGDAAKALTPRAGHRTVVTVLSQALVATITQALKAGASAYLTPAMSDLEILATLSALADRLRWQHALAREQDKFRLAMANTQDTLSIYCAVRDKTGKIVDFVYTFANAAACRFLNMQPGDLVGRKYSVLLPGVAALLFDKYVAVVETGQPCHDPAALFPAKSTGWPQDVYADMQCLKYEDGLIVIRRNITDRHQAEKQIRESEKKYRDLVETINEGIWIIDQDAHTTFVNPKMAAMLGYTVDEMMGRHLFSFMDEHGVELAQLDLARRQQGIREQHEFEFLRKDGARIYALLETTPLTDETGAYTGAIAGVMDVTDRKRMEEDRAQQQIMLLHAGRLSSLGEMSASLAHELNNPLGIIALNVDVLLEDLAAGKMSTAETLALLGRIKNNVNRAVAVIDHVRTFARQHPAAITSRQDPREPVQLALALFTERFKHHHVRLQADLAPDVPQLYIHAQRFEQVVVNLLSNALYAVKQQAKQATGPDLARTAYQAEIRVTLHAIGDPETGAQRVVLEVADNGLGMDDATCQRCCDPFFTTKPAGDGSGLGLPIALGIVKEWQGVIEVESAVGQGSLFRVILPVTDAPPTPPHPPGAADDLGTGSELE